MSASSMIESKQELESKAEVEYEEYEQSPHELHTQQDVKHGDKALQIVVDERIELSAEDVSTAPFYTGSNSRQRIRRKTDRHVIIILAWVYFLQILDKSVVSSAGSFATE
jgi:hypothetical protein